MANEATLIVEKELPVAFTCAEATGIEKGTFLTLSDPNTVAATGANANAIVIGIAAEEKIGGDGKTKIGVYMRGIFKVLAGGAITVGDNVESHSVAQEVVTATQTANATANIIGKSLETAADTDTFLMDLNPIQIKDPA
tara:strand:+ start:949 stop:1365 length:417 start_codon:yes stop_codon:yes gene_type:complete